MNVKRLLKLSPRWEVAVYAGTIELLMKDAKPHYVPLNNSYHDGWLADPFVLDVSDEEVELLVEDFRYKDGKGRMSKVTVDRRTNRIIRRKVLLEGGHYSFPAILRVDGKVYIYPEQSRQGRLDLFEYCAETETCRFVKTLSEEPLTDAIIYKGVVYATRMPDPNGSVLELLPIPSSDFLPPLTPPSRRRGIVDGQISSRRRGIVDGQISSRRRGIVDGRSSSVRFAECTARNAGDFFEIDGVTYRPAQECNRWYGHAVSIQKFEDGKFTEVRRIPGIHTLNSYKGVTVVDRKVFPYKWLYWLLRRSDK